jgi:hypothetical protein
LRAVFSENGSQIAATDFAGHCAIWTSSDGKRVGEFDLNPVPLAQQLATAQQKVNELLGEIEKQTEPVENGTNSVEQALTSARAALIRVETAQARSRAYSLHEHIATERQDQIRLTQAQSHP